MRSLLVLLVLAATSAVAHADGYYFTESFGGVHVGNELGAQMPQSQGLVSLAIGMRSNHTSLEIYGGGTLSGDTVGPSFEPIGIAMLGLDLKYSLPVTEHFELYVKGSASKGWLTGGDLDGYAGRGLGASAGAVLKMRGSALGLLCLPLFFTGIGPKITGALYFEDGYDFYRFHRDPVEDPAIDASLTHWTFGFAMGSDF